jgi:hypothetical protein
MSAFELSVDVAVFCGAAEKYIIFSVGICPLVVQCHVLGAYCPQVTVNITVTASL